MENINAKNTILICSIILVFLWVVKVFDISYPLTIVSTNKSTELSVVGEGKVDVLPDTAYVELGISAFSPDSVDKVEQKISETNNSIINALGSLGIKKEDIKTSNYSINPEYNYEDKINKISGYNGNVTLTVKIKDVKKASLVLGMATKAGANQVYGLRFSVENPSIYREKARNNAISNAKEQAQKMAKTLGINLGKISNIIESSPGSIAPFYARTMDAKGLGGAESISANIETGSQTITSTVTLYFEKK